MYSQIDSNKRKTALLIALFILIVLFIGWAFSELTEIGPWGVVFAAVFSLMMALISYYQGDKVALSASGAKPIAKQDNPYVYRMVENLCITAGIPTPKIYIIDDPAINAFATGRDPQHASIAVTTGAIELLENEELEGVLAHEISHIKNYDIRLMTVVIVLVGMIVLLSDIFWRMSFFGGRRRRDSRGGGDILAIVGLILLIFAPLFGKLIQLAISRKREFLADASGALLTRYPEGLARALEKIQLQNRPMEKANLATAHLFISSPFSGMKQRFTRLFSTHPPLEERIRILRQMT